MALSTREAKYMVVVEARMGIFWMKDFIGELGIRKRNSDYTLTSKVSSTLPGMPPTTPRLSIFRGDTIGIGRG